MQEKLENFLVNKKAVNEILENSFDKIKIYKEDYDDRFSIIYSKYFTQNFLQKEYINSGYFDKQEKVFYIKETLLKDFIKPDFKYEIKDLRELEEQICNEIDNYIKEYSLEQPNEFIKSAELNNIESNRYYRDSEKNSIYTKFMNDTKQIEYELERSSRTIYYLPERSNFNLFYDYIISPTDTIKKYSAMVMDKNREQIGQKLITYKSNQNYLDSIYKNEKQEFNQLYLNKDIYNCLKKIYAKFVNITIRYGDAEHTFKFDCEKLMRDLKEGNTGSSDYGANYNLVSKFITDNDPDNKDKYNPEFKFSNIVSITYGKNEVYNKEDISKELNNDEIEMEM